MRRLDRAQTLGDGAKRLAPFGDHFALPCARTTHRDSAVIKTRVLDPYADILGVDFPAPRLRENLEAFASIAAEIRKLRSLDLTAVHPPIVFDPTAVYRPRPRRGQ